MKRILIVHPRLGSGGSEARALALIAFLQEEHHVTLLTSAPFESDRLNAAYQTEIDPARIAVDLAPMPRWLRGSEVGDAMRGAFVARHVRRCAQRFDLCISAYNFTTFGRRAIQFIADFSWDDAYRVATDPPATGIRGYVQRQTAARSTYLGLCSLVAGGAMDPRAHGQDIVVANSRWSAELLESRCGVASRVIYPPVLNSFFVSQEPRSNDFVLLGRIARDKRVLEAIEVLARVRERGHDFNLHIIGAVDDEAYGAQVRALAAQHGSWVRMAGGVYGEAKFHLLARHSFAVHMRAREAFGIAVAEQVKMGLIPFVRANSAPAEIVANPRLCFNDGSDAVEVIDRLLRNPEERASIRDALAVRGQLFSRENFIAEARELVQEALANGRNGS